MAKATALVLGGGVGGLITANELRKRLGKEHRVVLVDKDDNHVFWPSLLWLQVGLRKPDKIVRDLGRLRRKGIEVVKGQIQAIDAENKSVQVNGAEIVADHMVVSLGAALAPERIPGLAEAGHNLYSVEGATAIRDARKEITEGNLVVLVSGMPFRCPAAPYEAAMLLEHDLRKRKVRDRVSVSLYSPEPAPMGVTGPEMSGAVRELVVQRGISYYPKHQVTRVDPAARTLHFANGEQAGFDMLVYIPPHIPPPVVTESGLGSDSGWMEVDRSSMESATPGVFAIGDVVNIPLAMGLPLPKAGVFAHHQAEAVAETIASRVTGKGQTATFSGQGECFIEVGGGRAGFGKGNFYTDPTPTIKMYKPTRYRHVGKVLFEKYWFRRWL